MQTGDEAEVERMVLRRLHRLKISADPNAAYKERVAAVRALQAGMAADHPLKNRDPERLLAAVRQQPCWISERDTFWQPITVEELFDLS